MTGDEKRLREDVETKPSGVERERRGDLAPLGLLSRSCLYRSSCTHERRGKSECEMQAERESFY